MFGRGLVDQPWDNQTWANSSSNRRTFPREESRWLLQFQQKNRNQQFQQSLIMITSFFLQHRKEQRCIQHFPKTRCFPGEKLGIPTEDRPNRTHSHYHLWCAKSRPHLRRHWSWDGSVCFLGALLLLMAEIRRSPVEVGSLSHYLQGFIHPRWCRISEPSTVWLEF